ncbi:MAG: phage gp6-like head-tail connector protein [Spartobacteria bacterium]|nr:phage gp6-like head-tail connector protein [Spartobacteria bacterium]
MATTKLSKAYPVTLAELKSWAKVDYDTEDTLLSALLQAATHEAENRTRRTYAAHAYQLALDEFPDGDDPIELDGDFGHVLEIAYTDEEDSEILDPLTYDVSETDDGWEITGTWPAADSVTVEFVPGAEECPEEVKAWIKIRATSLFQQRHAIEIGRPVSEVSSRFYDGLLDQYFDVERLI